MQFNDDLLLGPVVPGGSPVSGLQAGNDHDGSSPMDVGIGPLGRIFAYAITPIAAATANLAALQTLAGAGNMVLTAGAGVTVVVKPNGTTVYQFDVPRAVSLTSAGNESAVNFTVSGYDIYGQSMTQVLAGPNANTVTTKKAFWQVVSIAANAAVGTNTSAGTSDVFGLPVAVLDASQIDRVGWANVLAADAGTFTAADTTSPATSATGDVRGTYKPSSASNGTNKLMVGILLLASQCGPNATRANALGQTQA